MLFQFALSALHFDIFVGRQFRTDLIIRSRTSLGVFAKPRLASCFKVFADWAMRGYPSSFLEYPPAERASVPRAPFISCSARSQSCSSWTGSRPRLSYRSYARALIISSEQTSFGIVVVFSGNLLGSTTVVGFDCLQALELIMKDTSGVAN